MDSISIVISKETNPEVTCASTDVYLKKKILKKIVK